MGETKDSGRVGSIATLTIDAGNRQIGGPYEILWSSRPITEETTDLLVVKKGEFPRETTKITVDFTIPEAAYGRNYVLFRRAWRPQDPYGFAFTVIPDIKVSPTSGSPGTEITVRGTGFPARNKEIRLSFDGKDTGLQITASELGSFTVKFTVPETNSGRHELKAYVENMYIEDTRAFFEVTPTISLEPKLPEIGAEVTVSGKGFAAGSQVTIKYDDITIAGSPVTDQKGSFSHKFKVPESPKEKHIITATDRAGNTATYGLPLEDKPPPAPMPLHPCRGETFGLLGPQSVTFKWEAVEDPSGVSYTLEVGRNIKVWPPVALRTGMTGTTCVINLEPGTYYWRVKAVDGAGNESGWEYAPYPFKVGALSVWYLALGGLLFLVLFIIILRIFLQRLSQYIK